MVLSPAYGKLWKQVDEMFLKLHPSISKWIQKENNWEGLEGYFSILEAISSFGAFPETTEKII